jgi:3D (Asp-Asp-Asp) domain-containing protein
MNYSRNTRRRLKFERNLLMSMLIVCLVALVISGLSEKKAYAEVEKLKTEVLLLETDNNNLGRWNAILEVDNDIMGRRMNQYEEILPYMFFYEGEFEITYYTSGPESTGKTSSHPAYGVTASGASVKEGQTVAADWDVLPPGTKVFIEGVGIRTVEDKGGLIKGNCIDVYVEDVEVARELGRHKATVYVLEEN